jgi:hypothetical protein
MSSRLASAAAVSRPRYQLMGVRRVRTIELILSVTELNVCPGAITGTVPVPVTACSGSSGDGVRVGSATGRLVFA